MLQAEVEPIRPPDAMETGRESLRRSGSWNDREKLALAARILAHEGHFGGLAGQLTLRDGPGRYLTLAGGTDYYEATSADFLVVDDEIQVIEGTGRANPANRFHTWIYRQRPDVRCILHSHPPATSALSATGQPLAVAHMDMCMFYNRCGYLADWPGVPVDDDEGIIISRALGDKKCALLANHGLVVTGESVEEALYLAFFFERAAALQLSAMAAGTLHPVKPELAEEAGAFLMQPRIVEATFAYLGGRALKQPDAPGLRGSVHSRAGIS